MPILIRETDVEKLLTMDDALKLVEDAFLELGRGTAENRPRQRVRVPAGVLNVMAAGLPSDGYMGFKVYTTFGGKARFWFHLFDAKSGEYLAVIEADRLGQMRTGAASGVATMYLARADAQTAGIIGAGWQAESQLAAVCAVRKLRVVRCFSRDEDHRRSFAAKMQARLDVAVQPAASAREAVFDSDIVITVTTSEEPVIEGQWLMPGTHINAAGGNWAHRREINSDVVSRASAIFVDSLEQAKIESGDLISPVADDVIKWDSVQELGDLVAGKVTGRVTLNDITLYKSHGIALEDVAVAGWVYQRARALKIGEPLPIEKNGEGTKAMTEVIGANQLTELKFVVNGEEQHLNVEASRLLANVLIEDLGLTGVKVACGMANCGACTVLVDGTPIYSCVAFALDYDGRHITTIEGLARHGSLHPVQQAFIEEDALQCGFCTPGQILSLAAFLKSNPDPTNEEIRQALTGNLCRCGAYVKIQKASIRAAQLMRES